MTDAPTARGRAALAMAAAAREAADRAWASAANADQGDPDGAAGRIIAAREVMAAAIGVTRWQVVAEILGGMTYEEAAAALNLNVATTRARYERAVENARLGVFGVDGGNVLLGQDAVGSVQDPDPAGTAASLDSWLSRHADFVSMDGAEGPVARALRLPVGDTAV